MPDQKLTDVPYIGEQTAEKLRKKLRGNRPTSRAGEPVSVEDATKFGTRAKNVLDARQQRKLAEASDTFGFKPTREARQQQAKKQSKQRANEKKETIRRGDFAVGRDAFGKARDRFEELPEDERREDRNSREPVTTDFDQWSDNVGKFDYPGVDTPQQRKVRQQTVDNLFTPIGAKRRAREAWRDSKPTRTDAQERLGETPEGFNAERTGVLRDSKDGEFVERPLRIGDNGGLKSANGRSVSTTVQDPTIGRDPGDGEFVDRPLPNEPTISAPDFVSGAGSQSRSSQGRTGITFGVTPGDSDGGGMDPFDLSSGALASTNESREIEFGGEQIDLTQQDTDDLEQMNDFLTRNLEAEIDAERAKGGFGTSDMAQDFSARQVEVQTELDRRR